MNDREALYEKCTEIMPHGPLDDEGFRRAVDTAYEAGLIDGIRMGTMSALASVARILREHASGFGGQDEELVLLVAGVVERVHRRLSEIEEEK